MKQIQHRPSKHLMIISPPRSMSRNSVLINASPYNEPQNRNISTEWCDSENETIHFEEVRYIKRETASSERAIPNRTLYNRSKPFGMVALSLSSFVSIRPRLWQGKADGHALALMLSRTKDIMGGKNGKDTAIIDARTRSWFVQRFLRWRHALGTVAALDDAWNSAARPKCSISPLVVRIFIIHCEYMPINGSLEQRLRFTWTITNWV